MPSSPNIEGLAFREALQAVHVSGGGAANVIPDEASVKVNLRFAPDRSNAQAEDFLRSVLAPVLESDDKIVIEDVAPGAMPSLNNPRLAAFIGRADLSVTAKLGWTDVARFAEHGIPAANFGPGDATVAHTAGEYLEREPLEWCFKVLRATLTQGL